MGGILDEEMATVSVQGPMRQLSLTGAQPERGTLQK